MILLLLLSIALFAVDLSKAFLVTKKVEAPRARLGASFSFDFTSSQLVGLQVVELDEEQRVLLAKAVHLNKEAAKLTSPSTFTQSAKLQRTAIFNEKQAEKLDTQQVRL